MMKSKIKQKNSPIKQQYLFCRLASLRIYLGVVKVFSTILGTLGALEMIEAATRSALKRKKFLEILQNSQENTYTIVSFLIKLQASGLQLYLKKRLWHRCFPVNFVKFLRTPFLQNTSGRLLLQVASSDFTVTVRRMFLAGSQISTL